MRNLFCNFINICIELYFMIFCFTFKYILLYTGSVARTFSIVLLNLFQISLYFSSTSLSFIKISSTCTHFWKHYTQEYFFIIIFKPNEIFKNFFTKRNLVRCYGSINVSKCDILKLGFCGCENFVFQFRCYQRL